MQNEESFEEYWKRVSKMTIADYGYSKPDYLNSQFPREVSSWGKFPKKIQQRMKEEQRQWLIEKGYTENKDGSFTRDAL